MRPPDSPHQQEAGEIGNRFHVQCVVSCGISQLSDCSAVELTILLLAHKHSRDVGPG